LWQLQQPGLVDRGAVRRLMNTVMGKKAAALPLRELEKLFLQAELARQQS